VEFKLPKDTAATIEEQGAVPVANQHVPEVTSQHVGVQVGTAKTRVTSLGPLHSTVIME